MNPAPPCGPLPPDLLLVLHHDRANVLRITDHAARFLVGIPLTARIGPEVLTGTLRRLLTGPAFRRLLVAVGEGGTAEITNEALSRIRVPCRKSVVWLPSLRALAHAGVLTGTAPSPPPEADTDAPAESPDPRV